MTDIILELLRAAIVGSIVLFLVRSLAVLEIREVSGWQPLLFGFALVLFGTIIDITDNFEALNRFVIIGDTPVQAFLEKVIGYLLGFSFIAFGIYQWLPKIAEHQRLISRNLEKAEKEVKILQGFIPICASCKNIRDDKGFWKQIEGYISENSEAVFSHSICPACAEKMYPDGYASFSST